MLLNNKHVFIMSTEYQNVMDQKEMVAQYIAQLIEHADEICANPEMSEAPSPFTLFFSPSFFNRYRLCEKVCLGDLLRCWTTPEDTPWRRMNEQGHLCYIVPGCTNSGFHDACDSVTRHMLLNLKGGIGGFRPSFISYMRKPVCPEPMSLPQVIARIAKHPRVIVNIPHASTYLPKHCGLSCPREDQERIARYSADLYTDEMAPAGCFAVTAPVSRIVVDMERFVDDAQEPAAKLGSGVIPTRAYDGTELRNLPSEKRRKQLLRRYYYPHHEELAQATRIDLDIFSTARILDLHSYPETYNILGVVGEKRPDVCIGFEDYHCPRALAEALAACAARHGLTAALNDPYSGSLVPLDYYRKDPRVISVMLEIKRSCYMDEQTLEKHEGMKTIRRFVAEATDILSTYPVD